MKSAPFLALALLGATVVRAAPIVTIDGFIGRGSAPENGSFTATVEVTSSDGDVLVALSTPLVVTDGTFSLDLDLEDAVPALTAGEVLSVDVDLGDGLARVVRLGPVFAALEAARVDRARLAQQADLLGDIPAEDLVADTNILAVPVAFANASGVPEGIADGVDNGTVDSLTGLAITGGVLDVAAGGVTDIAAGTLTGAQIADGSVSSTQLAALSAGKVADGTLTGANFATGAFAVGEVSGTVNVFKLPAGCTNPFTLATSTTSLGCLRRTCTGAGDCTNNVCLAACTDGFCENVGPSPSGSTRTCSGASEGMEFLGRLIKDPTP